MNSQLLHCFMSTDVPGFTRRMRLGAYLRYRRDVTAHNAWARLLGRCPQCRYRNGHHRFGCSRRPGQGLKFSMRRIGDGD